MEQLASHTPLDSGNNLSISREDVHSLRRILSSRPRDLLLFDLATQTGIHLKDLLQLRVSDFCGLAAWDPLPAARSLLYLTHQVILTKSLFQTFATFIKEVAPQNNDYLFRSRKRDQPLNLPSASNMISGWFQSAGISGITGARGLYKIWQLYFKEDVVTAGPGIPNYAIQSLEPIKTITLQETVYQRLIQNIVSGKIPPGEKLTIGRISNQMDISTMPVREALNRLAEAGFITIKKKKSATVNTLSKADLIELQEIRLILETSVVEKVCMIIKLDTLQQLHGIHKKYMQALRFYNVDEVIRLNQLFHHTIYKVSQMPKLFLIIRNLWDQISPYYHILLREKDYLYTEENAVTHEEILEGLKQKDTEMTVIALRADLTNAAKLIIKEFEQSKFDNN